MLHALRHPLQFRRDHRLTVDCAFDYLDGQLSEEATERIERHAKFCPKCRDFLNSLRTTLNGLRTLRAGPGDAAPNSSVAAAVLDVLRAEAGDDAAGTHDP